MNFKGSLRKEDFNLETDDRFRSMFPLTFEFSRLSRKEYRRTVESDLDNFSPSLFQLRSSPYRQAQSFFQSSSIFSRHNASCNYPSANFDEKGTLQDFPGASHATVVHLHSVESNETRSLRLGRKFSNGGSGEVFSPVPRFFAIPRRWEVPRRAGILPRQYCISPR